LKVSGPRHDSAGSTKVFLYQFLTDFSVADRSLADGLPLIAVDVEELDETFVGLAVRSLAVARHQEKLTALTPPGS
jgi:hypothetical protein